MSTIKLSKQQWEFIGKKAGWIKNAQSIVDSDETIRVNDYVNLKKSTIDKVISLGHVPATQQPLPNETSVRWELQNRYSKGQLSYHGVMFKGRCVRCGLEGTVGYFQDAPDTIEGPLFNKRCKPSKPSTSVPK